LVVIHDEHPFATPEADRDPARRFRGRLIAPVTVVTAGSGEMRAGLTVSSLVVADGEPPLVLFLCGKGADLLDAIQDSGRFVVHVLAVGDSAVADRFAGVMPSPGGVFSGLEVEDSAAGPVMPAFDTRAECSLVGLDDAGAYSLVRGRLDHVTLGDTEPLAYFRGGYLEGSASA
jgi:3-hydroxy-9,10-secoandrosta-1,3,5(10)-triene-9,17-dione monooxygenase reductase component